MTTIPTAFLENTNIPFTIAELNSYGKTLAAMGLTHDNDAFPALMRTAALPIMLAGRDATLAVKDVAPSTAFVVGANTIFIAMMFETDGNAISSVNNGTTTYNIAFNSGIGTGAGSYRTCFVLQSGDTFTTGANSYALGILISSSIQSDITRILTKITSTQSYIVPDDKVFILTAACLGDITAANSFDTLYIDGVPSPPIAGVQNSVSGRNIISRPIPINERQALHAGSLAGGSGLVISGMLFDKNTGVSNPSFDNVNDGDAPSVTDWNALGKSLQAITSPAPDDNNGSPIFGRSIGLPLAFDWNDPNFRAMNIGGGQTYTVEAGMFYVILFIGQETSSTTSITPSGGTAFNLSTTAQLSGPCMLILGEGDKISNTMATTGTGGCATGFLMSVPAGISHVLQTLTNLTPYIVDPTKMFLVTCLTGDSTSANILWRIDGSPTAVIPNILSSSATFAPQDNYFVTPLKQYQSIAPASVSITGLISGIVIDTGPASVTTLPTSISSFSTITKQQGNSWGKALDAIGITKDNAAKMMAARGCLPFEIIPTDPRVGGRGIYNYTIPVPTGMQLIITQYGHSTGTNAIAGQIDPIDATAFNIIASGALGSAAFTKMMLVLGAGDTLTLSTVSGMIGFFIPAPSDITRILKTVSSGSTHTATASKITLITTIFSTTGTVARLTVGGIANISAPTLVSNATFRSIATALAFKAGQVIGGNHATNTLCISGWEFNAN